MRSIPLEVVLTPTGVLQCHPRRWSDPAGRGPRRSGLVVGARTSNPATNGFDGDVRPLHV